MSTTNAGGGPNAPAAGSPAEALAIELAVTHMQCRGWIDEPNEQIIADLKRLYHEHPIYRQAIEFNGDALHDLLVARPAEYLAGAWQIEQEELWQRYEAPRWSCPCGVTFGAYDLTPGRCSLFTLTADGVFDTAVTECPSCGRNLTKVQAEQAEGQLGFVF